MTKKQSMPVQLATAAVLAECQPGPAPHRDFDYLLIAPLHQWHFTIAMQALHWPMRFDHGTAIANDIYFPDNIGFSMNGGSRFIYTSEQNPL